jgi:hypothetical protein
LVTIGLRKSSGSETSPELFFFRKKKKISHRMESLGHRCKPLGCASSVSSVLLSRTKREQKSFALKKRFASTGTVSEQDADLGESGKSSCGLAMFIFISCLSWRDEFDSWIWFCFRVLSV